MTRCFLLFPAVLAALPLLSGPALAERIAAVAPVVRVTLHPQGAVVTRELTLTAPAGAHEVIVPGLPAGTDPAGLRASAQGATIGSVSLQQARALPNDVPEPADLVAARDEVRRLERALRERDAATAAIRAEAEAAAETIAFLRDLAAAEGAASGDVAALAQTVETRILEARRRAIAAETAAAASAEGREQDQRALEMAQARLAALSAPVTDGSALVLAVETGAEPAVIEITTLSPDAGWRPVYDMRLDRKAGQLAIERGVIVSQATGEDWTGVRLSLSSGRLDGQSAPTEVDPEFLRIEPTGMGYSSSGRLAESEDAVLSREMATAPANAAPVPVAETAALADLGLTVRYDYPAPVSLRAGADALRLRLDDKVLAPEILAEAAPRFDDRAYLVAEAPNTLGEPLLPGEAVLFADGARVGTATLDLIAPGDELRLGFGPIDGLLAERRVPNRVEGEGGILVSRNEDEETAILRVENLTGEAWPLRIVDRVPVSQQEALSVDWSADPTPDETDPDGRRGVLVWQAEIAPAEVREIAVTTRLRWPDGNILIR